jgi:CubicO group peptidase (beta-lactamase class C family)
MSHGHAKTPEFDPGASANGKAVAGGILGRIEASPRDVGLDESKLDLLRRSIEEDIARGHSDGSVLLIARHGKIVMHEAIGYSDRANNRKALISDIMPIMSVTKQLTAAMVLRFVDTGRLALTTRIAEVIPEFASGGKERVTIRDALSHQAGLPMQHPLEDWKDGNEAYVERICKLPFEPAPEGVANYHAGAAHAVLGEVCRRLDGEGRSARKIMEAEIFEPAGMTETALSLRDRPDLVGRLVPIAIRDEGPGALPARDVQQVSRICQDVEFLAGGAFSTGYDIYRFAEMLRCNGRSDGRQVLSPAVIKIATTTIQTGNKRHGLYTDVVARDHTDLFPANIGLSFYIRGEGIFITHMGTLCSPRAFAGSGFGGQLFLVDPDRDLTFVHLVAGFPQLYQSRKRSQRICDLVISSVIDV